MLPQVCCPACNAKYTMDVLFSNDGARDALVALAELQPGAKKLLMASLKYVGMFAPPQRTLSFERVAKLLGELQELIEAGTVTKNSQTFSAPVDYWIAACEQMQSGRESMTLPLKSHGYLTTVVAGIAAAAEGRSERAKDEQVQHGHLRAGEVARQREPEAAPVRQVLERQPMPDFVRKQLEALSTFRKVG